MWIHQLEHTYDRCRGYANRALELNGASAIAAAVVRKSAIQFARLVSLYHAIAGSYCCVDQPTVLVVTAILSAIKLTLSLRQQRNRPDSIRKSRSMRDDQA
jgi:hypothetical protein